MVCLSHTHTMKWTPTNQADGRPGSIRWWDFISWFFQIWLIISHWPAARTARFPRCDSLPFTSMHSPCFTLNLPMNRYASDGRRTRVQLHNLRASVVVVLCILGKPACVMVWFWAWYNILQQSEQKSRLKETEHQIQNRKKLLFDTPPWTPFANDTTHQMGEFANQS